MKIRYLLFASIMMILLVLSGCSSNEKTDKKDVVKQEVSVEDVELTISAAASLQDALNDITAAFVKVNPQISIVYNFGASGALQQQISQGAPVDLFLSAAEDKFDLLVNEGLIDGENGTDLVGNEIVIVIPRNSAKEIRTFKDLVKADKLSIGTPESVPAGKYAKETLENLNIWNSIEDKVVFAKDVRQVLTYVETGNVDAGIVYKTDALTSSKVEIVSTADGSTHTAIIYPVGVIKDSSHPKEAKLFYQFLQNEASLKILEGYGFKGLN